MGEEWLHSAERHQRDLRLMRRRTPFYKATISTFQALARLTHGPPLTVFYQDRLGINGEVFPLPKLQTMTERNGGPIQNQQDYRKRTSFLSRLARALRVDEMPQIVEEVEHRKRGGEPRYSLVGVRPMNTHSHALIQEELSDDHENQALYEKWRDTKESFLPGHCSLAAQEMHDAGVHGEGSWGSCFARAVGDVIGTELASRQLDEKILREYRHQIPQRLLGFLRHEVRAALPRKQQENRTPL